jgi:hypothetical protein
MANTKKRISLSNVISIVSQFKDAINGVRSGLENMQHISCELKESRHIANVLRHGGMNKSIISIINPGNIHTGSIKSMPAQESLDDVDVDPTDRRVESLTSEIDDINDSNNTRIKDWLGNVRDNLGEVFSKLEDNVALLDAQLDKTSARLSTNSVENTEVNNTALVAINSSALLEKLNVLKNLIKDIDIKHIDPLDNDSINAVAEHLKSFVEALNPITGAQYDQSSNTIIHLKDNIKENYIESKGTVNNLGYSYQNVLEIITAADELCDELEVLIGRAEGILTNVSDMVNYAHGVDNDVPPQVENAIGNEDDIETPSNVSQIDIIHDNIAHHVSLFIETIDAALSCISCVLHVADPFTKKEDIMPDIDENLDIVTDAEDILDADPANLVVEDEEVEVPADLEFGAVEDAELAGEGNGAENTFEDPIDLPEKTEDKLEGEGFEDPENDGQHHEINNDDPENAGNGERHEEDSAGAEVDPENL